MKKIYCLVLAVSVLAGCASKRPAVATYIDPHTHARTDLLSENMLETLEPIREVVYLNASRVFRNARDYRSYLEVDYLARVETGFLEIPSGETLVILADGQELKFSGSGSINSRKKEKDQVSERAIYAASGSQLRTIANAENVKVSMLGRNGVVQRNFTPENFKRFRDFVHHYVTES